MSKTTTESKPTAAPARAEVGPTMLGSEILVAALEREGVDNIFAYPGGASMELHQALTKSKRIRTILPRHEQGGERPRREADGEAQPGKQRVARQAARCYGGEVGPQRVAGGKRERLEREEGQGRESRQRDDGDLGGGEAAFVVGVDAQSGEAWATLALVHYRSGLGVQAIAAARRAVTLEPDNWRHHFRLAYVGWGEERLRASHRALTLFPGFALAHFLSATVHVARQAFDFAEQELRAGAAAQDAQQGSHTFTSVGSHWLLGLVRLARGDEKEALDELRRELAFESAGHLYSPECVANTWYAIGALLLRQGRPSDAAGAFEHALERLPAHLLAMVGLSVVCDPSPEREVLHAAIARRIGQLAEAGLVVDAATGRAAMAAGTGGPEDAAPLLDQALGAAPGGAAGWLIPVDPLLNVTAREQAFAQLLARLRTRAA